MEDYEILQELGKGSFGKVTLARHKQTSQIVSFLLLLLWRIYILTDCMYFSGSHQTTEAPLQSLGRMFSAPWSTSDDASATSQHCTFERSDSTARTRIFSSWEDGSKFVSLHPRKDDEWWPFFWTSNSKYNVFSHIRKTIIHTIRY
jgi:hypothetical protein